MQVERPECIETTVTISAVLRVESKEAVLESANNLFSARRSMTRRNIMVKGCRAAVLLGIKRSS